MILGPDREMRERPDRGMSTVGHYGRVLRYVLLRDALRNLSLEPSAGCRAVNHLGLTGSDPLQG